VKRIQDADVKGKKVLVRVDYNVPLKDGKVADDERIVASLETIEFLLKNGAAVILCSHLGRPEGKVAPEFSLKPIAGVLKNLSKKSVQFVPDCVRNERNEAIRVLNPKEILLLENLRFLPEEETNDDYFAKSLVEEIDLYVNDAFSASHRAHASIVGIAKLVPAYAGMQLQKEVDNLSKLLENPERPFAFISGGAKISDKIGVLENLLDKIDIMMIGGGMANTFLCARGFEIGCSFSEKDQITKANEIVNEADKKGVAVFLPEDAVVTKGSKFNEKSKAEEKDIEDVQDNEAIADIGSNTVKDFTDIIKDAKTIFWNGPVGVAEYDQFASGTKDIAKAVAEAKAFTVIGGGDTIAAIDPKLKDKFSFVSMAGGASMEFLEGKSLPGLEVLK
jgi:phosphoglycerate kinase